MASERQGASERDALPGEDMRARAERLQRRLSDHDRGVCDCDDLCDSRVVVQEIERELRAVFALGREQGRQESVGLCRNGYRHYCPNCDNSFGPISSPRGREGAGR